MCVPLEEPENLNYNTLYSKCLYNLLYFSIERQDNWAFLIIEVSCKYNLLEKILQKLVV